MYEKSLIILEDKRTSQYLKMFLKREKKEVANTDALLSDIDAIRNELYYTKNTSNIRKSLGRFINDNGFPFLIILDYTIDFGLKPTEDPDRRKLLRTFLIAFVILANAKGYGYGVVNIILLCNKKDSHIVGVFRKNPVILLKQLKTVSDRVNGFIKNFIMETDRAARLFNLHPLVKPTDGNLLRLEEDLERIVEDAESRITQIEIPEEEKVTTGMIDEELEPAKVVCRVTLDRLYFDGEIRPLRDDEKKRYQEKNIILDGPITVKTVGHVNGKLLDLFTKMAKINPFKKEERIFIRVPDTSTIDGSFASSVGSFLANSLGEYTGISVDMGRENVDKLKNSNGFIAIRDYLIKNI